MKQNRYRFKRDLSDMRKGRMKGGPLLSFIGSCAVVATLVAFFSDSWAPSVNESRDKVLAPSFSVDNTILQSSGDTVTVSWSGVPLPGEQDWVGLWSADGSMLFAWFFAYEQPSFHRKQSKWPQLYPPSASGRRLRTSPPVPGPSVDALEFSSNIGTGSGSATFRLYNFRNSGYIFKYYPSSSVEPSDPPSYISAAIQFLLPVDEPTQVHIALTAVPGEMRIMWISNVSDAVALPTVVFGSSPGNLAFSATGTSHTFNSSALCHSPIVAWGWLDPGWIHDVVINAPLASNGAIQPGTIVYYTVGSNGVYNKELYWFVVPEVPGTNPNADFVWIMYADMGTETEFGCSQCRIQMKGSRGPGVTPLVNALLANELTAPQPPAFIAHVGDVSYARNMAWKWDIFFHTIEPIAARIPYMIENGNHEYDHQAGGTGKDPSGDCGDAGYQPTWGNYGRDSHGARDGRVLYATHRLPCHTVGVVTGECGVHLFHRFHMPDNGNSVFWYGFGSNNLWMITLSTEHSLEIGAPQRTWLEAQLASVNRTAFPWLVVAMHRPMYTSEYEEGGSDHTVSLNFQRIFGSLFQQYSVDLVVAGHYHSYERTCPVYNGTCSSDGNGVAATTHMIVGTAGIGFDSPVWLPATWSEQRFPSVFAYARVHIQGANDLTWQLIDVFSSTVLDEVHIHSNHTFPYHP